MSRPTRTLRLAVADEAEEGRAFLQKTLLRLGYEVAGVAASGRELVELCRQAEPDLVIIALKLPDADGLQVAAEINRERETPMLLIGCQFNGQQLTPAASEFLIAYLIKPVKEADLAAAIQVGLLHYQQRQALRREVACLHQTLEDRKVIERAKGVLMKRGGCDEPEAFRRLQKVASDKNRKLVEIAEILLTVEEAFQPPDRR
jgi:response regulator NasT